MSAFLFTPEFLVVCLGIFLLMLDSFTAAAKSYLGWTAIVGLVVILGLTFYHAVPTDLFEPGFYVVDPVAIFFKRFLLVATILTVALAMDYAPVYEEFIPTSRSGAGVGEFFLLPVFACAGLMWMVSAADFIMIFVSLELVTICFYVLVASMRKNLGSLEAGVKYLILGALSTGFLVYGITWIIGLTGRTSLQGLEQVLPFMPQGYQVALMFGLGLVLVALGFKVAAVPFQFWIPDVYQGAPTPVTAFLSVASKAAGFVVLLRVIEPFLIVPGLQHKILAALTVLAALTLIYGNLAALPQINFKRLMAYSSIAHAGYLLVGVASVGSLATAPAIGFYLAGYLLMTFLAFLVLQHVSRATGGEEISDFNGLGRRSPVLALGLLIAVASLAGVPFTVGFLGKFFIFEAALQSGQYTLVVLGMIAVACGFYYYFKVVRAMYWQAPPTDSAAIPVSGFGKFLIALLSVGILVFGIYPEPLVSMLR